MICLVVLAVLAVLGVTAAIILTALDANASPDLPDPLVNNVGDFAASASVITMILLGIHILRTTSTANTRAGVAAIADARRDLKEDTDEIPNLARLMRNPHYVVVRDPGPFDKLDRERTMRVTDEAEASTKDDEQLPAGMATQIWTMAERATERRLRGNAPA